GGPYRPTHVGRARILRRQRESDRAHRGPRRSPRRGVDAAPRPRGGDARFFSTAGGRRRDGGNPEGGEALVLPGLPA
ncbi:MAG: hypothetical protein ACK56F_24105, partial [bacterium]